MGKATTKPRKAIERPLRCLKAGHYCNPLADLCLAMIHNSPSEIAGRQSSAYNHGWLGLSVEECLV
jgi:hypothetical protein